MVSFSGGEKKQPKKVGKSCKNGKVVDVWKGLSIFHLPYYYHYYIMGKLPIHINFLLSWLLPTQMHECIKVSATKVSVFQGMPIKFPSSVASSHLYIVISKSQLF